ncbi:hypothetical protein KP509_18G076400 [Ceratopteris richardii]|uniref:Uncharacterized protein n=1 Tax=Ceratopteris richardii TaxID=49495 RepID=A0A8T2SR51_CERRI|nr:hypothetical protein KP509_18G076400 [Ceratopteris richardii]
MSDESVSEERMCACESVGFKYRNYGSVLQMVEARVVLGERIDEMEMGLFQRRAQGKTMFASVRQRKSLRIQGCLPPCLHLETDGHSKLPIGCQRLFSSSLRCIRPMLLMSSGSWDCQHSRSCPASKSAQDGLLKQTAEGNESYGSCSFSVLSSGRRSLPQASAREKQGLVVTDSRHNLGLHAAGFLERQRIITIGFFRLTKEFGRKLCIRHPSHCSHPSLVFLLH